jgi:hypothetical protein
VANATLASVTIVPGFLRAAILSPATAQAARDPGWLAQASERLPAELSLGPCECLFLGEAAGLP